MGSDIKKLIMRIRKNLLIFGIKYNYRSLFYGRKWYEKWIEKNEQYNVLEVKREIDSFKIKPLISIIVPVYNVEKIYLIECIESVINQHYEMWELCIADDCSTLSYIPDILDEYSRKDKRIKIVYRKENGHISEASNTALRLATGKYTALLDNDDLLAPFALYEVVKSINSYPEVELIYSNEDKVLDGNRVFPFFKKGWNRNLLLCVNYISHLTVFKTNTLKVIGGFRQGYEGVQDWDLILRVSEHTKNIVHIPKVLYHWRMIKTSTSLNEKAKPYIKEAQKKAVRDAIIRREKR
jgi:glycosyltransferase involved in cell wall biosynthesis